MNTRFAAVDVGTNTVKLTIVERDAAGTLTTLLDTSKTARLGEGMHLGRLREAAMRRTIDILAEYASLCRDNQVLKIDAVGTAALRNAVNGAELLRRAAEVGISIDIIPGNEEARLSFLAVLLDPFWHGAQRLLVIDIGGGSTEIITGERRTESITWRISLPMGAVRLTEDELLSDPPTIQQMARANQAAQAVLKDLSIGSNDYIAVGVGGTFVNMAAVRLAMQVHDPDRIHGTALSMADIEEQASLYAERTVEQRKRIPGLDPARADIILGGAIMLCRTLSHLRLDRIAVSCRGLRWGVLYDRFRNTGAG